MGTHIYREGSTHEFNGIPCEIKVVSSKSSVATELRDGWVMNPNDLYPVASEEEVEEDEEEEVLLDDLPNQDIRLLAKQLDIEDWETRQIKTLKEEITAIRDNSE
jgi:NACalpha-BTF3-like transcription factor